MNFKLVLMILVFFSCQKKNTQTILADANNDTFFSDDQFTVRKHLAAIKWDAESMMAVPDGIFVREGEDILIIKDRKSKPMVHLFSIENKKYIKSFGVNGRGPGEFLNINSIDYSPSNKIYWFYDGTLKRLTGFSPDIMLSSSEQVSPYKIIAITNEVALYKPQWLNTNILVGTLSFSDERLAFIDFGGDLIKTTGRLPKLNNNIPEGMLSSFYGGTLRLNKDRIVVASKYCDMIDFYDEKGSEMMRLRGPEGFNPELEMLEVPGMKGPITAIGNKTRIGYQDVCATDDYIYLLYSGRSRKFEVENNIVMSSGRIIYVIDWEGKPIARLSLDYDLRFFSVDESKKQIYGIAVGELYDIVSFNYKF